MSPLTITGEESGTCTILHLYHLYNEKKHNKRKKSERLGKDEGIFFFFFGVQPITAWKSIHCIQ